MLHLPAERLAALVDETPNAAETAHLERCPACAREHAAQLRLRALAGTAQERELARRPPPLTSWDALSPALRREGLLPETEVLALPVRAGAGAPMVVGEPLWRRASLRAAAALFLVAGGAMLGRASAGAPPVPLAAAGLGAPPAESAPTAAAGPIGSEVEALALMARAERDYKQAAAFLATSDSTATLAAEPEMLRTRLAALDQVGEVTRAALSAAPQDPVINQYYLAALGARAATIRQLDRAAPGVLVGGF